MKKILYLILCLFPFICKSQIKGDIVIDWTEKSKVSYGSHEVILPQFNIENYVYDDYKKYLQYVLKLPISSKIDENSLQISNIVYENIASNELGNLSPSEIPSKLEANAKNSTARDKFFVRISLSPIIKEGSVFKKIKSFSYSLGASNARLVNVPIDYSVISNSVLATGDWHRFYVTKSGVYVLDKSFIKNLGLPVDNLDPRKIKIYGNGGRMIPLKNNQPYPADLTENAIQITGENDGVFNDSDFILFYAEGVDNWNVDSETTNNLYADKSFYYITYQGNDGKRILDLTQPSGNATETITAFDDYQYHEIDKNNLIKLGRRWFGEEFNIQNEQSFDFSIPNIDTTVPINLQVYAGAVALTTTSFDVMANSAAVGNISLYADNDTKAVGKSFYTSFPASENVTVSLTYNNNGVPDSKGFLDYIILKSKRKLTGYGKQFRFQYDLANINVGIAEYQITNASSISQIWDITDIYYVSKVDNINQSTFSFKANLGETRKYIAIDPNDLMVPSKESQTKVANQNLKGTIFNNAQGQFQDIDYLIITPSFLSTQAEKLANFHRNYSQLNVKVVTLESIYQEFCSGKQDVAAIRNFIKYVYFNASTPDKKVKYVNLFGDASYDFKNRVSINTNIVPIYHALNSYTVGESSFTSDDFFGMMDDEDGNEYLAGDLDIAVGRMIHDNAIQADELVQKVIDYNDIKSYGSWRNNYVCVADDPDPTKSSDNQLQFLQNKLTDKIVSEKPFINATKILLDSYSQVTSSGGARYPKAREDFFNAFEKGTLVVNYLGHGGEDGLSQERIWEKIDGQNLVNRYKYPLFITITCDFSRFDNPFRPTAGEYTYWNPKGGAIAMITTVREIGQSTGQTFNESLSKYLFSYGSSQYTSIAEALRLTKNNSVSTNVVFYIGDPALMLAIPKPQISLTKVNDMPITGTIDDFKSLSYVKLSGEITDENNNPLPAYNGELAVQIFDKKIQRVTLRNDNIDAATNVVNNITTTTGTVLPFTTNGETIFRGNAAIVNGKFEFGFVVPRDITTNIDYGRISFYSKRNQTLFDKSGVNTSIKVGGVNLNAPVDNIDPTVKLYMNDQNFISGGITNESPIFLAYLEDENGINTASGIGHDIVAILDGDETKPYKLNDYYETELDNYKKGKLKYPFRNLAVGLHTITFIAFDVYNNRITADIQFIVVGDESVTLTNVLNYPNPFVNYTQFWFTHNKPFEPLEVQVQVMTITGKIVFTKNQIITTDGFLSREITWDGKDDFGDKTGKGVYVYKLTVKSILTNSKTEKYEKLVIL